MIVTAGGQKVFTADRIYVVSTSADTGGGAHSDANGTSYENLCFYSTASSPCQPLGPGDSKDFNNGTAHGGLEVDHREFRESDGQTQGSGLEITGVRKASPTRPTTARASPTPARKTRTTTASATPASTKATPCSGVTSTATASST